MYGRIQSARGPPLSPHRKTMIPPFLPVNNRIAGLEGLLLGRVRYLRFEPIDAKIRVLEIDHRRMRDHAEASRERR